MTSGRPDFWLIAAKACTPKQVRILELRERHGFSLVQIAFATRVSVSTVRSQLRAAYHNIDREMARKELV